MICVPIIKFRKLMASFPSLLVYVFDELSSISGARPLQSSMARECVLDDLVDLGCSSRGASFLSLLMD